MGKLSVSKMLEHSGSLIAEDMSLKQQQINSLFARVTAAEQKIIDLDETLIDFNKRLNNIVNEYLGGIYERLAILEVANKETIQKAVELATDMYDEINSVVADVKEQNKSDRVRDEVTRANILVSQMWETWTSGEPLEEVMKVAEGYLHDCDNKWFYEQQD